MKDDEYKKLSKSQKGKEVVECHDANFLIVLTRLYALTARILRRYNGSCMRRRHAL